MFRKGSSGLTASGLAALGAVDYFYIPSTLDVTVPENVEYDINNDLSIDGTLSVVGRVHVDSPFDPSAPWLTDLDLGCNDIVDVGDITHGSGCSADFSITNESTGNMLFGVNINDTFIFSDASATSDTLTFDPGSILGTPFKITGGVQGLRIEVPADKFIDLGPRWKSSDTVTYSDPFEFAQMNGTVNDVTGTWDSAVMRAEVEMNATSGGTGFGSQLQGLVFQLIGDGTALSSDPNFGVIKAGGFTGYWNGGARTISQVIGLGVQAGTNTTGTITDSYGMNAQVLTILGGTITNACGVRSLMPQNFFGGTITTGYGVWINGAGDGTTRWGIYQDSTTPDNALAGDTRIGSVTAPTETLDVTGTAAISSTFKMHGGHEVTITAQTGAATIANGEYYTRCNSGSAFNLTLPTSPEDGQVHRIKNVGAGVVTLIGTIDGGTGNTLTQYDSIDLTYNGTDWDAN